MPLMNIHVYIIILHVQTRASNIDVYCWIVVVSGSDVPISVVSTVVSGLMVVSMIVVCDRCVAIDDISISGTTSESCDVVVCICVPFICIMCMDVTNWTKTKQKHGDHLKQARIMKEP
jgi:hypothetical protein